jgi:CubicO group peptidase (beta-lactamase class C family)
MVHDAQQILSLVDPEQAGMSRVRLHMAMQLLDREVAEGRIPGAVALIARNGKIVSTYAAGWSEDAEQTQRPMEVTSVFDLASLTKVMSTLPAVLILLERGLLHLKDPVSHYIPEFSAHSKDSITIEHLLTHSSGLTSHEALYNRGWNRAQMLHYIWNQPLEYAPGTQVVYSDLGFITLGVIVEKITGFPLNEFAYKEIYLPLGMDETGYLPAEPFQLRAAATEYDHRLGRCKRGEVHDENAYAMGGVAGHAGLFSTVKDIAVYGQLWLNGGLYGGVRLFSPLTLQTALRGYTDLIKAANRGLGWVLRGDRWDASGDLLSAATYSHTGFTGTSIVCDPVNGMLILLLTNRVHYGRAKPIQRFRNLFHNAVAASIELERVRE